MNGCKRHWRQTNRSTRQPSFFATSNCWCLRSVPFLPPMEPTNNPHYLTSRWVIPCRAHLWPVSSPHCSTSISVVGWVYRRRHQKGNGATSMQRRCCSIRIWWWWTNKGHSTSWHSSVTKTPPTLMWVILRESSSKMCLPHLRPIILVFWSIRLTSFRE